jgi:capsular polysaccharide biosynthesis protein
VASLHHEGVMLQAQLPRQAQVAGDQPPGGHELDNAVVSHIFANADVVVAAHGAGLTHTLVARPGTCVVELMPAGWLVPCYLRLSGQLGLQHHAFVVEGGHHGPIEADVERVLRAVRECMANVPPREEEGEDYEEEEHGDRKRRADGGGDARVTV